MKIGLALKQEIENTFQMVPSRATSDEVTFLCPEPGCNDKTGNRSVNLNNGKTNCWRCGKGGNFIGWARRLGYRFSNEGDLSGGGSMTDFVETPTPKTLLPPVQPIALPKGYLRIVDEPESVYTRLIKAMAERKNLTLEDFIAANVGFTRVHPVWESFAIFPVVERGVVVYYQGRTYIDEADKPTKRFPNRQELKYGARYWVYNIDEVREREPGIVIVVESILNVLSLKWKLAQLGWDKEVVPVAVFKHKVSAEQWIKLTRCRGVKEVCLMFDHDATDKAWESSYTLTNRTTLTVAEMPEGPDNKKLDPNDDVEEAIRVFESRKLYTVGDALGHKLKPAVRPSLVGTRYV